MTRPTPKEQAARREQLLQQYSHQIPQQVPTATAGSISTNRTPTLAELEARIARLERLMDHVCPDRSDDV